MITADREGLVSQGLVLAGEGRHGVLSLKGLSTDTKPTEDWNGLGIDNGSTFLEMDTQKLYFYNEETKTWEG